jgi:hypothetical protein
MLKISHIIMGSRAIKVEVGSSSRRAKARRSFVPNKKKVSAKHSVPKQSVPKSVRQTQIVPRLSQKKKCPPNTECPKSVRPTQNVPKVSAQHRVSQNRMSHKCPPNTIPKMYQQQINKKCEAKLRLGANWLGHLVWGSRACSDMTSPIS